LLNNHSKFLNIDIDKNVHLYIAAINMPPKTISFHLISIVIFFTTLVDQKEQKEMSAFWNNSAGNIQSIG